MKHHMGWVTRVLVVLYVKKLRGIMVNEVSWELPSPQPEGPRSPEGFWPRDFPREAIHRDTPKAFQNT